MSIFKAVVGTVIEEAFCGPAGALMGGSIDAARSSRFLMHEDLMKMAAAQRSQQQWMHNPADPNASSRNICAEAIIQCTSHIVAKRLSEGGRNEHQA